MNVSVLWMSEWVDKNCAIQVNWLPLFYSRLFVDDSINPSVRAGIKKLFNSTNYFIDNNSIAAVADLIDNFNINKSALLFIVEILQIPSFSGFDTMRYKKPDQISFCFCSVVCTSSKHLASISCHEETREKI